MKSIPFFMAVVSLVVATAAAPTPMPTPAPVALQYDQITRMIATPATPPPPGSFADDYQTLVATLNPPFRVRLRRFTFYYTKGWIRTDDTVAQTATISKCPERTIIMLNLAKKTYTQKNTQTQDTDCLNVNVPAPPASPAESPGTEDLTIAATMSDLGPKTIDGIDARAFCPLPQNPSSAGNPLNTFAQVGCKPRMHITADASVMSLLSPTNVVLYQLISTALPAPQTHSLNMVMERGHLTWLDQIQADALFMIPPDFSEAK
jgi:hypothetical protein